MFIKPLLIRPLLMNPKRYLFVFLVVLLSTSFSIRAQNNPVMISITVPVQMYETLIYSPLIAEFEQANPHIQIHINRTDDMQLSFIQNRDKARQLAENADIIYLDSSLLSPNIALDGVFLDLNPLIQVDNTFSSSNFYSNVWDAFQWNNRIWAIPISFYPIFMSYQPDIFETYGISPPTANWTTSDLVQTARIIGENGQLAFNLPFMTEQWLLRSLLTDDLADESSSPPILNLNTPANVDLLNTWNNLHSQEADISVDSALSLSLYLYEWDTQDGYELAFLPNGQTGMRVNGLAISAGTPYPEEAYTFIKFIAEHPQMISIGRYGIPARQDIETSSLIQNLSPEQHTLLNEAIPKMIPLSQTRFVTYLIYASQIMLLNGLTAEEALQAVQEQAIREQQSLWEQSQEISPFSVVSPPPRIDNNHGVVLNFGFHAYGSAIGNPNDNLWDSAITDFVANDPQVTAVMMETLINRVDFTQTFDCFFTPHGINQLQPDTLFSLDPLMMADPNFNPNDFLPFVMDLVIFNGQTYGYPWLVQYETLDFDITAFEQAGITLPDHDWGASDFVMMLEALTLQTGNHPVLGTTRSVSTDLLQIIASFGGLPIDYRNNPPTANFMTPENVEAIRQVLDLVREGYIHYIPRSSASMASSTSPITTNSQGMLGGIYPSDAKMGFVLYPSHPSYRPIGLGVGAFYISNQTQHPEACYRWISAIVNNPTLLNRGMYATYPNINHPLAEITQGQERIQHYQAIINQLEAPNVVIIPSPWTGNSSLVGSWLEHWLYEAFTAYITDDADLAQALIHAKANADAYLGCVGDLPPQDGTHSYTTRYNTYRDCAVNVDPTIEG